MQTSASMRPSSAGWSRSGPSCSIQNETAMWRTLSRHAMMHGMDSSAIALENVSKSYAGHGAVNDVSLEIREGEFFSLLGPSGCGKTTSLRMIAGFVEPDAGRVLLRGEDVTRVPPNKRPVNMVFQQYALFP